jgi:Rv0078B-related antitoxin
MFSTGVRVMEQNLRRRLSSASDEEIRAELERWLQERPGAEAGDAVGRPVAWPRRRG